jgi:hypothetical protein
VQGIPHQEKDEDGEEQDNPLVHVAYLPVRAPRSLFHLQST